MAKQTFPEPEPTERVKAFQILALRKQYVEFRYVNQKPPVFSASAMAAKTDTVMVGPLDEAKGFLDKGGVFWAKTTGHWCVRFVSMNRRVKYERGSLAYYADKHNRKTGKNYEKGEYLWRSYRLEGVKMQTVLIGAGRQGKVRMFPHEVLETAVHTQEVQVGLEII